MPVSLGRLGETAKPTINQLLKLAQGRKTNIRVAESCIIALGLIAGPEETDVLPALEKIIKEGKNDQGRHFAFISMAQILGRAAKSPEQNKEVLDSGMKYLLKELTKSKKRTHTPWAALSLALLGREYDPSSQDRTMIMTKIMDAWDDTNDPSHKSCFAVCLGLLNALPAGEMLMDEMLDTNDRGLKGYLAVSLGMMRYTESLDTLRDLVLDNSDPKMRLQVATSLGLMGDVDAVPTLVKALKEASTLNVISSLAKALGLIGDRSAIQPLESLINDDKAPGLARAFGCVAIGLIGEKFDFYWNTELSTNANYRTVLPSQYEIMDIL
jgi:hypothetical protein